jgi:glycerophosphoryl diester phosphodiesterase
MAAFRLALELGADGVELDVHLSADGVPVVLHDFTLDATTDGTGPVSALPLAELRELDAGSSFDASFAGERIPTLEEVFGELGQDLLINVELKTMQRDDGGLGQAVVELVKRHGLADRVLISSFNPFALQTVSRLDSRIPLGFLYAPGTLFLATRLLAAFMRSMTPAAINPHWALIREATVERAHARDRRVVAWTVDEPDRMRRLAEWGVDAIITNYPDRLGTVLEAL